VLETPNIDGALLAGLQIAASDTEVGRGADHAAGQAQRVVGQDGLGRPVVVLGRDTANEGLDIQLGRTRLLARGVGTFQASR
jgi:hypothetical protein